MIDRSRRPLGVLWLTGLIALLGTSSALAQFGFQSMTGSRFPAEVQAHVYPSVGFPGEPVRLDVTVTLEKDHYIYAFDPLAEGPVATSVTLEESPALAPTGAWKEPAPKRKHDRGFDAEVQYHDGKVTFSLPMTVQESTTGQHPLKGAIRIQICTDTFCLPPRALPFETTFLLRGGEDPAPAEVVEPADEPTTETVVAEIDEPDTEAEVARLAPALAGPAEMLATQVPAEPLVPRRWNEESNLGGASFMLLMWTSFLAGMVALLTPCVFPLIPITIAFFTKRTHGSAGQRIGLVTVYSGSIVLGFALLGFGLAVLLKTLNLSVGSGVMAQIAANPWLNLVLAGIFILFAFSLFGMFDMALPSSWANKMQKMQGGRADVVGAILLAVVFVIVSFTCTAPIVGPLIVLAFEGHWLRPFAGLASYGLGFALPFFILGLIPGAVRALPKSGTWLNATKVTMGLIEVGLALKFLSNTDIVWNWGIFTREVLLACWAAIALVTTFYLLGTFRLTHDSEVHGIGPIRLTLSLVFGAIGLYFSFGLFSGQLHSGIESLLPPERGKVHGELIVVNDLERAQQLALAENRPLFIDFTGWTCTNCRLNELEVFPKPEVSRLLDEYVMVKLYTDDAQVGEKYQRYQEQRFGTFAIPYYAIMTPDDEIVATYAGLIGDESEFLEFLRLGFDAADRRVALLE